MYEISTYMNGCFWANNCGKLIDKYWIYLSLHPVTLAILPVFGWDSYQKCIKTCHVWWASALASCIRGRSVMGCWNKLTNVSREKNPGVPYFPWNTGWFIGILISWPHEIIPAYNWVVHHPLYQTTNQGEMNTAQVGNTVDGRNPDPPRYFWVKRIHHFIPNFVPDG